MILDQCSAWHNAVTNSSAPTRSRNASTCMVRKRSMLDDKNVMKPRPVSEHISKHFRRRSRQNLARILPFSGSQVIIVVIINEHGKRKTRWFLSHVLKCA